MKNKNGLFLFCPYYHTGGAEKVHLEIVKTIRDKKAWVIFTEASVDTCFRKDFENLAFCVELWPLIRKKGWLVQQLINAIVFKINSHKNPLVLGANCLFFYSLIPRFKSQVYCTDLVHAFVHDGEIGVETSSLPYVSRIDKRITINEKTRTDFQKLYERNGISAKFVSRIETIINAVDIPEKPPLKKDLKQLSVLFVSRNSAEKRVWLVGQISHELFNRTQIPISFIGPNLDLGVFPEDKRYCKFLGSINDVDEIQNYYREGHILVLCSTREGMPMVIMEAMAQGMVVLSTDVGGIHEHVQNGENGFLVSAEDATQIKEWFSDKITYLVDNPSEFHRISNNAFEYATANFSQRKFNSKWRNFFETRIYNCDKTKI